MAFYDTTWYANYGNGSSTGYFAVATRPQNAAVVVGQLVRQFTLPAVGSERCFVCIQAGTTANTTDATWNLTRGTKTNDGSAVWLECTGMAAVNGDQTNTPTWTTAKNVGSPGGGAASPSVGVIIQRNNGASYQICTTTGSMGAAEPSFSNTAGVPTSDGSVIWTSLGPPSNFAGGGAPHARVSNACATTWWAAGNTLYVGDNHNEQQSTAAAITITPAMSSTAISKILCHNHAGSYPPGPSDLTTGASISTTVAQNVQFNPNGGQGIYVYGIAFAAGVGMSTSTAFIVLTPINCYYFFENCSFKLGNTSTGTSTIQINTTAAGVIVWNNCQVSFGGINDYIEIGTVDFTWQNTGPVLMAGSIVPAFFLGASANGRLSKVLFEGLDLSQISKPLLASATFQMSSWVIKDCALNAAMTIPAFTAYGQTVQLIRSSA